MKSIIPKTVVSFVGGTIIGKTTCEDMCYSGASFLTHKGPVLNPINKEHSAGGSSSGSGVVVATNEADMAVGGYFYNIFLDLLFQPFKY